MMYLNAKNELIEAIQSFISKREVSNKRTDIIKKCKNKIKANVLANIFNNNLQVALMSEKDLYNLVLSLEVFHNENPKIYFPHSLLSPKKYFTEYEALEYNIPLEEEEKLDIFVFENVSQITRDIWIVPIVTPQQLRQLAYNGFLNYNPQTQRGTKKIVSKITGEVYETIDMFPRSVSEIKKEMKNNQYIPTALAINVLRTGEEKGRFNNGTFTLYASDKNDLLDGMHRTQALIESVESNENFSLPMQLYIFNFDVQEARHYIRQQAQQNPIAKEVLKSYNMNDMFMIWANEIANGGNATKSKLFGTIGKDMDDVKHLNKLTTITKLGNALALAYTKDSPFDLTDSRDRRNGEEYFINYFNELLSIFKEDLARIPESRKSNYKLNPNMIYAYIYIASKLYKKENWQAKLETIITKIDFSIGISSKSSLLEGFGINRTDLNRTNKQQLMNYLDKLLMEV